MSSQKTVGIGIIGAGLRGAAGLGMRIAETYPETGFVIRALCDRNPGRMQVADEELKRVYAAHGVEPKIARYGEYAGLIADECVDLVMITTPQYVHRGPALAALAAGKKTYLDKPLAHDVTDALAIAQAEKRTHNRVLLGFTRRYEAAWLKAHALLAEGAIGDLQMMLMRAVIPYHNYFSRWHRNRKWSGGALNDKASHHFDVFNWFSGGRARAVHGFGGVGVLKPDPNAPERCNACDCECPYRNDIAPPKDATDKMIGFRRDRSWAGENDIEFRHDTCVFKPGADIYDHAAIHFQYDNRIVAALFYAIFGPHAEDQETFELVGSKGRMIVRRHTGEIDLIGEYGKRREVINCRHPEFASTHFGADLKLVRDMRRFYDGMRPVVGVPEGLEATRMVAAALKSLDDNGRLVAMEEIPDAGIR